MLRRLMSLLAPAAERERYAAKLEQRCAELLTENTLLQRELAHVNETDPPNRALAAKHEKLMKSAKLRVTNLKSTIDRLLSIMNSQWCGADEQATLRTARAIVEDELDGIG